MTNYEMLQVAIDKLENVNHDEVEEVELRNVVYDDNSSGFEIKIDFFQD